MDKELKIVVSVFLVFAIYGLTSFFQSGIFATPVFLNQLVLLVVAITFYLLNSKQTQGLILLAYVGVQVYTCLIDGFTVSYLAQKFESNSIIELSDNIIFNIGFILVFAVFWIFAIYKTWTINKSIVFTLLQLSSLILGLCFFFFFDLHLIGNLLFMFFTILWIWSHNKNQEKEHHVLNVLSYQLLLMVLLEGMEYFL